jgi:hypothetical protein
MTNTRAGRFPGKENDMLKIDITAIMANAAAAREAAEAELPAMIAVFRAAGDSLAHAEVRAAGNLPPVPAEAALSAVRQWADELPSYRQASGWESPLTAAICRAQRPQYGAGLASYVEAYAGVIAVVDGMTSEEIEKIEGALLAIRNANADAAAKAAAREAERTPEQRAAAAAQQAELAYENECRRIAGYYTGE